jgi:tuberculosinol/isotuberculosinol synthase
MLEHGRRAGNNTAQAYLRAFERRSIEIGQMLFMHGLDTLLIPIFGAELLDRGDEYNRMAAQGMAHMASHRDFLSFYQQFSVRVHFYGDFRKHLAGTPHVDLIELFDQVARLTAKNSSHRLFFGVFADDATESIAELTIRHFQEEGDVPLRRELVTKYYGEYVEPATLFIGFDKFSVFDYPLLGVGREDLYFTTAPSAYLTERQLRQILYDHVFLRQMEDPDYSSMSSQDLLFMQDFYLANREATLGVGGVYGGIWYPITRIQVDAGSSDSEAAGEHEQYFSNQG